MTSFADPGEAQKRPYLKQKTNKKTQKQAEATENIAKTDTRT